MMVTDSQQQKTIRVLPRADAERRHPFEDEACISITNPRQAPADMASYADVLRLGFHDTDQNGGGFTTMSYADAKACLQFARQHAQHPLTVHCQFGVSRSAAVGIFLAAWLRRPVAVAATDILMPNPWVINQLRAAAILMGLRTFDFALIRCALFGTTNYLLKQTTLLTNHEQHT